MPEGHATLSASGSAKWLTCPASLAFEALIAEPDVPTIHAQEGTAAHEVLERSLVRDVPPVQFIGEIIDVDKDTEHHRRVEVTQEMVDAVEITMDYVKRLYAVSSFYEQKVDYSHVAPGGYGTSDVLLEVMEKTTPAGTRINRLYVIDFKYGMGVRVDAFMNSQLLLYALGAIETLDALFERDIQSVVLVIMQPRLDHIDEFEISIADLIKWADEQKPKARLANALYQNVADGPKSAKNNTIDSKHFNPTDKGCRWCRGRKSGSCKAYAQLGYSAAIDGFDDLTEKKKADLPAIEVSDATIKDTLVLDAADMAAIYSKMHLFIKFLADLENEIARRIDAGEHVPGLKIEIAKKNRAWLHDDGETIKHMRTAGLQQADYIKKSLISPAEAEKVLKKVKPKDHQRRYRKLERVAVHRPDGDPRVVRDEGPDFNDLLI